MKKLHEKNFSFKTEQKQNCNCATLKNNHKMKLIKQQNLTFVSDVDVMKEKNKKQFIDKVILIINIVFNVLLLFFMGDLLNGFKYANGLGYTFSTARLIGIIIFIVAEVTGLYLTIKMFITQNLKIKLLLVSVPLTLIMISGLWFFYNFDNIKINNNLAISTILGINNNINLNLDFKYIILAIIVYVLILYFLYDIIMKNSFKSRKK